MRLHENRELFADAIQAAAQHVEDGGLGIKSIFLLHDEETMEYLKSDDFTADFASLLMQDQQRFDKPEGWQNKTATDSPIVKDLHSVWKALESVYLRELPDLAYQEIPSVYSIEDSIAELLSYIAK